MEPLFEDDSFTDECVKQEDPKECLNDMDLACGDHIQMKKRWINSLLKEKEEKCAQMMDSLSEIDIQDEDLQPQRNGIITEKLEILEDLKEILDTASIELHQEKKSFAKRFSEYIRFLLSIGIALLAIFLFLAIPNLCEPTKIV